VERKPRNLSSRTQMSPRIGSLRGFLCRSISSSRRECLSVAIVVAISEGFFRSIFGREYLSVRSPKVSFGRSSVANIFGFDLRRFLSVDLLRRERSEDDQMCLERNRRGLSEEKLRKDLSSRMRGGGSVAGVCHQQLRRSRRAGASEKKVSKTNTQ